MSITSFSGLMHAVLNWLGQPGDPFLEPHVPDMIRLFEAEAQRRLRTKWREVTTIANVRYRITQEENDRILANEDDRILEVALPENGVHDPIVELPLDFHTLRQVRLYGNPTVNYQYLPPDQLTAARGEYYTIEGLVLRLASSVARDAEVLVTYQQGLTPLGPRVISNWLLQNHPDAYLFGTLAEAEAFIANDERVPGWLARRDAAFTSILEEDRHARWAGSKLVMRADNMFSLRSSGSSGGSGNIAVEP